MFHGFYQNAKNAFGNQTEKKKIFDRKSFFLRSPTRRRNTDTPYLLASSALALPTKDPRVTHSSGREAKPKDAMSG